MIPVTTPRGEMNIGVTLSSDPDRSERLQTNLEKAW